MKKNIPTPTKHVLALSDALQKRGVVVELEHWDGHKHVDMYFPDAKIYIEIDGLQHYTDPKQFSADLMRDHYSGSESYFTKHISNQLVETHLDQIADSIAQVVKERSLVIK
jgi:very-short-patch-repair endonuclease